MPARTISLSALVVQVLILVGLIALVIVGLDAMGTLTAPAPGVAYEPGAGGSPRFGP